MPGPTTSRVVPCSSLLVVRPLMAEIAILSDYTMREILANNDVVSAACPEKKK